MRPRVGVVVLVFLVASAAAAVPLAALQPGSGIDPDVLRLTVLATAVGAAVVAVVWRAGLPYPPVRGSRTSWRGPLIACLGLTAVFLGVLWVVAKLTGATWPVLDPATLDAPLVSVVGVGVLGAAAEEVGWRGVVQPALETVTTPLRAGLGTGLLFGLGHVYVLAAGAVGFALFVVGAVGLSVALAAVTAGRSLAQRVVLATLLHWCVNVGTLVLFSDGTESLAWLGANAVAGVAMAVVAASAPVLRDASPRP